MIAPPGGMPPQVPQNSFMGQVCFKWPLNYPFVSANDGGAQIFHYLPMAIADGLNISRSDVQNMGLKPLDTTQYQGFITTLALFTIPADMQTKLAVKLRTPSDSFWHNENSAVNDLTNLINTACPLPAAGDSSTPNEAADPVATSTGGAGDGGAMGGDIGASRKVNSTSAIVASSAIVGAFAYGAAMFFVARRYRNKRIAHQRASSVPSTSRMTYGSIPGGAAAWMHGARNGRITPGSMGSRGSSSSQGRSVRTQQISAPVMAENSLGWN
ncbi:multicopy suppressor of a budding defect [Coniothyrium glycines]